jgi:hypothetical protein
LAVSWFIEVLFSIFKFLIIYLIKGLIILNFF